ncbi:MAG: hypothetical protein J5I93_19025 [Pirellulaceae bacterium]|nr:hypothetical protein [Pirellulaceae bacterium]
MPHESVDQLQKVLTEKVFHYARDAKKAAGRALGTLVEIVTFYALKSWGFEHNIAIERPLPEFANESITHNVEYSLHPSVVSATLPFKRDHLPLTSRKILKQLAHAESWLAPHAVKSRSLLTRDRILRNSCTIAESENSFLNACLDTFTNAGGKCTVVVLSAQPFAIFECKRVGVEEGMKKGPQTIEKAKQGAYVARTVSSLQKLRFMDGTMGGLIQRSDGRIEMGDYYQLMARIIASDDKELLSRFILTVGVVSNHGNWFTSDNHNKELKVLAQSYDWLLFLTDAGLSQFIERLLLHPTRELRPAKDTFLASYTGRKGVNQFTKVKIALDADLALQSYFDSNLRTIAGWFNIIAPARGRLSELRSELDTLKRKKWGEVHG